jgi:hypothetical protein
MPVSLNNTQIVFNDATTQTTSGVTAVNVSTGISSTGGKTPTLTNTGVTSLTGAGTVSLSGSTGAITITGTGGSGTVTSVATGNGLQGGTITTSGTLSIACPGFNTVGSYCSGYFYGNNTQFPTSGANYGVGSGTGQMAVASWNGIDFGINTNISGTWKWMGPGVINTRQMALACRVS